MQDRLSLLVELVTYLPKPLLSGRSPTPFKCTKKHGMQSSHFTGHPVIHIIGEPCTAAVVRAGTFNSTTTEGTPNGRYWNLPRLQRVGSCVMAAFRGPQ